MVNIRWIVLAWFAGLWLTGCYVPPAKTESAIAWQSAPSRVAELNGRHYYLLEEGFTCTAGMIPGKAVSSWREHFSISTGQLLDWGSLCNDTQMLIGPVDASIEISPDLGWLRYQGKVYRNFATPPLPGRVGEQHE